MNSPETLVKFSNVSVTQESTEILKDISLEINTGITAIVGPSGAGKSTLALVANGLLEPTEGTVSIIDYNGDLYPDRRLLMATKLGRFVIPQTAKERKVAGYRAKKLGFIAQSPYIDPKLTAREYVYLPHIARGNTIDTDWVDDLAGVFEMKDKLNSYPSQLSGGEQQRIAMIAALAHKPEMVVADEPTSALDSRMADQTFQIFGAVKDEMGTSFIVVSHDELAVSKYADTTVRMKDGVIESVKRQSELELNPVTTTETFRYYQ